MAPKVATLVDALESIASMNKRCLPCAMRGVYRDATTTRLQVGAECIVCAACAHQPVTLNGVNQVIGFIPLEQPIHVVVARRALETYRSVTR